MSLPEAEAQPQAQTSDEPVRFGKYELLRLLARGGMGEVYLARLVGELGFEKQLVIKTILPELASNPQFIDMFAAEAKTAVALSHGNIVPIYELGRSDETFYIVMGYVDGPSVEQLLERARDEKLAPDPAAALHIARGILAGLAYAHRPEKSRPTVVHRDITPRNVLIDRSGQVRIVDFGIALRSGVQVAIKAGSTGYMAPEQARAEAADPRADVFSSACLLYELLTHEKAFPKEGVWSPPSLADLPEDVRAPLESALSVDPAARPENAGAFLRELRPAIRDHAGAFGDHDLATYLSEVLGEAWDADAKPARAGAFTPVKGGKPTHTYATRLTAVTNVAGSASASLSGGSLTAEMSLGGAPAVSPRRRFWPLVVAAIGGGGLVFVLARGDDPPATPAPDDPPAKIAKSETPPPTKAEQVDAKPPPETKIDPAPPIVRELDVRTEGATVEVDGKALDGPPFSIELPREGALTVAIKRKGYATHEFELSAQGEPPPPVTLEKIVAKPPGFVRVFAPTVPWAVVKIDGRKRGETPTKPISLPPGPHRLEIRCIPDACANERVLLKKTIKVESGKTEKITP